MIHQSDVDQGAHGWVEDASLEDDEVDMEIWNGTIHASASAQLSSSTEVTSVHLCGYKPAPADVNC